MGDAGEEVPKSECIICVEFRQRPEAANLCGENENVSISYGKEGINSL